MPEEDEHEIVQQQKSWRINGCCISHELVKVSFGVVDHQDADHAVGHCLVTDQVSSPD